MNTNVAYINKCKSKCGSKV